jgi:hypothetical protein
LLVAICLLGWLAPAGASFAVLIHLATDAHHHPDDARQLALAATHGHRHDGRVAQHEHDAVRESSVDSGVPVLAALGQDPPKSSVPDSSAGHFARPQPTESPPISVRSRALRL